MAHPERRLTNGNGREALARLEERLIASEYRNERHFQDRAAHDEKIDGKIDLILERLGSHKHPDLEVKICDGLDAADKKIALVRTEGWKQFWGAVAMAIATGLAAIGIGRV